MRYRKLGNTGISVSEIGYGLWGMSGWSGSTDSQSRESLALAARLGCTFYDSAFAYGDGRSDQLLGSLLTRAGSNDRLAAASKIPPMNLKWPASPDAKYGDVFPARHVYEYADRIRRAFKTDKIDLLQFHVWDDSWTDDPEFRSTVEKLKADGIIHAFGLSLNRWQPANGIRAIRTGLVDAVQVIYNIFDQSPEDELFPACIEHEVGVIARVALDEGSLGGKLTRDTTFPATDWRAKYFNPDNLNRTLDRVDALQKLVPPGMTLPEMAIRFILANPVVSSVIIGMRKPEHVRANLSNSDAAPLGPQLLSQLKHHRWDRTPAAWSD